MVGWLIRKVAPRFAFRADIGVGFKNNDRMTRWLIASARSMQIGDWGSRRGPRGKFEQMEEGNGKAGWPKDSQKRQKGIRAARKRGHATPWRRVGLFYTKFDRLLEPEMHPSSDPSWKTKTSLVLAFLMNWETGKLVSNRFRRI